MAAELYSRRSRNRGIARGWSKRPGKRSGRKLGKWRNSMPYVPSHKTNSTSDDRLILDPLAERLAEGIAQVSKKYQYDGAFLGELNYALTRLIQHLPRKLMGTGQTKDETRYWMQAGLFGVLLDVILEYKARVNQGYEAAQIIKSGDCYDTPYYSKLVEVIDSEGNTVGHVHVNMKRTEKTIDQDVLDSGKLVLIKG